MRYRFLSGLANAEYLGAFYLAVVLNFRYQKWQGSMGKIGRRVFVFTNSLADNYGMSPGDDEYNYVYN